MRLGAASAFGAALAFGAAGVFALACGPNDGGSELPPGLNELFSSYEPVNNFLFTSVLVGFLAAFGLTAFGLTAGALAGSVGATDLVSAGVGGNGAVIPARLRMALPGDISLLLPVLRF